MSFDTPLFFVLCLVAFALVRSLPRWQGLVLLAASLLCYSVAGAFDVGLVVFVVIVNYALSFAVARDRRWVAAPIVLNIALLAFFKYRHFLFPGLAAEVRDIFRGEILLPLGISFYIFQAIAYQVDLAYGRTSHIRSLWRFALFILLFAQLVAGPIVRANLLAPQVDRAFSGSLRPKRVLSLGLAWCVLGLVKKVVLADALAPHVDTIFSRGPADAFTAWLGATLFAFQIYFDFSGYCDIAIGAGYLFGFRLPLNFRQPYLATGPREFWQRWHITLSTWIRDYLYIPLGGNRGGAARALAVLFITMALAGLWHGANWTFIVWGLGWAAYVAAWRWIRPAAARLGVFWWLPHIVIVLVLWVFFRASSVTGALSFIGAMFGVPNGGEYAASREPLIAAPIAGGIVLLMLSQFVEAWVTHPRRLAFFRTWDGSFIYGALIGLAFWIVINPKPVLNPFIYFRF